MGLVCHTPHWLAAATLLLHCFCNPTRLCSIPIAKDCTSTAKESATSTDEREQQNSISIAPSLTEKDVDIPEGGEGDSVPSQRLTVKQLIQQKKMRKMQRVVRF